MSLCNLERWVCKELKWLLAEFGKKPGRALSAKMVTQYRADVERPEKLEVFELLASSEKLRAISGWSPKIKLADGLERTVNWWRKAFA